MGEGTTVALTGNADETNYLHHGQEASTAEKREVRGITDPFD